MVAEQKGLWSYVWFTPWHPANLRIAGLNKLSACLFERYASLPLGQAESFLRSADIIVLESGPALMLLPRLKRLCPQARFIYRVSDDLRLLRSHPVVIQAEEDNASSFDLISVPNASMLKIFEGKVANVQLQLHGINKELFDEDYPNPYGESSGVNAVFVGVSHVDLDFIERAGRLFPTWAFHIIGPIKQVPEGPNIKTYGEMAFVDTIPFIKHADIGLAIRSYYPGAESLGDSLKVMQYSYCRMPVVAPEFLSSSRKNIFYYRPGDDDSICQVLDAAAQYDRSQVCLDDIRSWDELAHALVGNSHA
jgi:2-beta-glucuronyltransferase